MVLLGFLFFADLYCDISGTVCDNVFLQHTSWGKGMSKTALTVRLPM